MDWTPRAAVRQIRDLAERQHKVRSCSLNLCAAETLTSELVREMLATDFARRYSSADGAYSGAQCADEAEAVAESLARELFKARYALIHPISGHVAVLAAIIALTQPGDTVMTTRPDVGGY